jgi:hypothetical protein
VQDARLLARLHAQMPAPRALKAHEAERLPATRDIVPGHRHGGPERVVDRLSERPPEGFRRVEDVISTNELAAIASGYAQMAGFAR